MLLLGLMKCWFLGEAVKSISQDDRVMLRLIHIKPNELGLKSGGCNGENLFIIRFFYMVIW